MRHSFKKYPFVHHVLEAQIDCHSLRCTLNRICNFRSLFGTRIRNYNSKVIDEELPRHYVEYSGKPRGSWLAPRVLPHGTQNERMYNPNSSPQSDDFLKEKSTFAYSLRVQYPKIASKENHNLNKIRPTHIEKNMDDGELQIELHDIAD